MGAEPNLRGRVAVVTGGGSGVGARIAAALAGRGAAVALVARSRGRLEHAAGELTRGGASAIAVAADLTDAGEVAKARERIQSELGDATILVNAAGTFGPLARIVDSDPDEWRRTIEVDLVAPFLACRAFLPGMLAARWGRVVNVGSAASLHPPGPLTSAYATAKAGLDRFTRQLAAEISGSGVTANVIHPGEVRTDMWADIRDRATALGADGEGLRAWADMVGRTGGDDPAKAADLVLRIVADGTLSGRFLWIENGLQSPLPSWDDQPQAPTFRAAASPR
jgi:NAD(P)-dependent dehydrogenase (short-subunit alcohol dehydrogenase family)